jgi:hypothetical protein
MMEAEKPHEVAKKVRQRSNRGCITCRCVRVTLSCSSLNQTDKIAGLDELSAMKADRRATGV